MGSIKLSHEMWGVLFVIHGTVFLMGALYGKWKGEFDGGYLLFKRYRPNRIDNPGVFWLMFFIRLLGGMTTFTYGLLIWAGVAPVPVIN